ncbi:cation:proton antiporter [Erysipelothrix urinaevulpis]|uniref:cation:proton antiporter n=1 Tax=Erysipelothrix urinaevulpis TaxID=2683717 RepID=UPI00135939D3|nr:cation:proton antiporter [Erysipelothrix urinaevulpis]
MTIFIKLALLLVFGLLGARVAHRLRLPNVTGYLIGGLFLGPSFLKVITASDVPMVNFINEIALSAIAFNIGGAFLYKDFKKLGKEIFMITVAEVVGVVAVVFIIMYFIMGQHFVFSLIVASMSAATAPAGTMMVIQQYRAKGPMTDTILPVAALDDALGIMVFGVALSLSKATLDPNVGLSLSMFIKPLIEIIGSGILGILIGVIFSRLSQKTRTQGELLSLVFLMIFANTGLSQMLGLSSLLSGMFIGGTFININHNAKRVFNLLNQFTPPINLLFFAMAGASLDLSILASIGVLGFAYVASRALGKVAGATFGAKIAGSSDTVVKYLGWALLPQGGVSIGLSMIVSQELPQFSEGIVTLILFSVLIFEVAGPVLAKIALSKANEI